MLQIIVIAMVFLALILILFSRNAGEVLATICGAIIGAVAIIGALGVGVAIGFGTWFLVVSALYYFLVWVLHCAGIMFVHGVLIYFSWKISLIITVLLFTANAVLKLLFNGIHVKVSSDD